MKLDEIPTLRHLFKVFFFTNASAFFQRRSGGRQYEHVAIKHTRDIIVEIYPGSFVIVKAL